MRCVYLVLLLTLAAVVFKSHNLDAVIVTFLSAHLTGVYVLGTLTGAERLPLMQSGLQGATTKPVVRP